MAINRLQKYLTAVAQPAFWPALARGVMPTVEHVAALRMLNPRTVIDVGANKGQFSLVARHLFPSAQIYAFEPLETERRLYQTVVSQPVRMYSVALGAIRGRETFYVASRADSSSLLAPGKNQQAAYGVSVTKTTTVDVECLADILKPEDLRAPVLIKLDVQGGELQVLQGAEAILPLIKAVYCEISFIELYQQQVTASTVVSYLAGHGFSLRGVYNISSTRQFGSTQGDFLFIRNQNTAN